MTPPPHTVFNHLALLLLRVPGFAGGSDYGAAAGHASGGAGVAEDSAQDAADHGTVGGAFGGVAAGADFVGDGAAVGEVNQGLREAGRQPALIDGESAGEVVSKPVVGVDQH